VTLVAGAFLGLAMRPAVDVFLNYLLASFMYIKTVHEASGTVLLVSLSSTVVFLVLNFAVIVVASGFFMGKAKAVFKDKFQKQVPLRKHAAFLGWGPMALLLVLALPAAFAYVADPLISGPLEHSFVHDGVMNWNGFLTSGPLVMVLGFLVTFWLARG